ncbi:MAG TPA: hypothetical protein ENJ00_05545 [Phycisphaerales bacterium]|nr:hypothetical protein [Phycisphaerales bacterium]
MADLLRSIPNPKQSILVRPEAEHVLPEAELLARFFGRGGRVGRVAPPHTRAPCDWTTRVCGASVWMEIKAVVGRAEEW